MISSSPKDIIFDYLSTGKKSPVLKLELIDKNFLFDGGSL